jgi:hypothetical protein
LATFLCDVFTNASGHPVDRVVGYIFVLANQHFNFICFALTTMLRMASNFPVFMFSCFYAFCDSEFKFENKKIVAASKKLPFFFNELQGGGVPVLRHLVFFLSFFSILSLFLLASLVRVAVFSVPA